MSNGRLSDEISTYLRGDNLCLFQALKNASVVFIFHSEVSNPSLNNFKECELHIVKFIQFIVSKNRESSK